MLVTFVEIYPVNKDLCCGFFFFFAKYIRKLDINVKKQAMNASQASCIWNSMWMITAFQMFLHAVLSCPALDISFLLRRVENVNYN